MNTQIIVTPDSDESRKRSVAFLRELAARIESGEVREARINTEQTFHNTLDATWADIDVSISIPRIVVKRPIEPERAASGNAHMSAMER